MLISLQKIRNTINDKHTELLKKMYLKVWKISFLCYPSVLAILYTILWLFLCRVHCNWMLDHNESFMVSYVVFGVLYTIGHLSYIHDATLVCIIIIHIIIITILVYSNINIYIQDICKYCHEADNQF